MKKKKLKYQRGNLYAKYKHWMVMILSLIILGFGVISCDSTDTADDVSDSTTTSTDDTSTTSSDTSDDSSTTTSTTSITASIAVPISDYSQITSSTSSRSTVKTYKPLVQTFPKNLLPFKTTDGQVSASSGKVCLF